MITFSALALTLIILAALLVGGCAGFLACALMVAAGSADNDAAYLEEIRLREAASNGR